VYAWIAVRIPRIVSLAALCALACTARPTLSLGGDCELASQCASPLVCRLGRCRDECRSDRDCRAGLACQLDPHGLGACELPEEVCTQNHDCPMPLVCLMGRCANACNSDVDCLPGEHCVTDTGGAHACRDTFMMHCRLNSECAAPLICANDGVCREQCETSRDCRDGTVCDTSSSPRTCVWPDGGLPIDAGSTDGGSDAPMDASIDLGAIDLGTIDMGIDAFAGLDMGIDVGLDMGPMIDTGCIDAFAPDGAFYDSGVLTGPAPPPQIAGGALHTCAIQLGSLRCWGDNSFGQLGDTTMSPRSTSAAVSIIGATAQLIASGRNFACATTASAVYCWGENTMGQVGNGNTISPQPTPVMISAMGATTITASADHACLLRAGAVSCWGDNMFGQIGDGSTMPRNVPTPTLALAHPAVDIAAGGRATCAVLDDGRVQCWGENSNGELGIGTVDSSPHPMPQIVPSITDAVEVALSTGNACARRAGGEVVCWGDNHFDELGIGTGTCVTQRPSPGPVGTLPPAVELAGGLSHVCARANDGSVWCWGDNTSAQSGAPLSTASVALPRQLVSIAGATAIGNGETASCAHVSAGIVCWGDDTSGELGNGTTSPLPTNAPQMVLWP
jgi:hypothetical protein